MGDKRQRHYEWRVHVYFHPGCSEEGARGKLAVSIGSLSVLGVGGQQEVTPYTKLYESSKSFSKFGSCLVPKHLIANIPPTRDIYQINLLGLCRYSHNRTSFWSR